MLPNLIWLLHAHGPIVWVSAMAVPTVLLVTTFAVFGNHLWLACLLFAPLIALAPIEALYIANYFHPSSAEILATIFASNIRETREYLGGELWVLLLCVAAALFMAGIAAYACWRSQLRWRHPSRAWVLAIAVATPIATMAVACATTSGDVSQRLKGGLETVSPLTDAIEAGFPFGLWQRAVEYRREWRMMREDVARLEAFRFHSRRIDALHQRQIYVLVIGESSRRDHWQLFGYGRPTNPQVMRISNLFPITNMVSSWSASIMAIPMIVTRKPSSERGMNWSEPSIVRVMQEAGFETYWISNQMPIGRYDSPVSNYAFEAQHIAFLNHASWLSPGSYDENLVISLQDALAASDRDMFIVLHMMGSHSGYDYRYPASFAQFQPTLTTGGAPASVYDRRANSYDNSILYTDHVLATIIHILDARPEVSAVWFESDHGEDLPTPTCTLSGHGNGTPYDFEIPAFVWLSNAYASAFPERIAAFKQNADKQTTSAVTFESLVDMAGLTFPGHESDMSLFSKQWRSRPRIVNGAWQVDIDHAIFSKRCNLALPPD